MTELKKKALWMTLLGFVLGVAIGVMFHALAGAGSSFAGEGRRLALLLYLLLSGLYGAVNMGSSALYGIDAWSILRCTLTHFLITVGSTLVFFGSMILQGWMSLPPVGVCVLIGALFVLVYVAIWLLQYLAYRRKVKTMNARLRAWRAQRKP